MHRALGGFEAGEWALVLLAVLEVACFTGIAATLVIDRARMRARRRLLNPPE